MGSRRAIQLVVLLSILACSCALAGSKKDRVPVRKRPVAPDYPVKAYRDIIEGYVLVKFDVTERGRATNAKIVRSAPETIFDESALKAIKASRWKPAIRNNEPYYYEGHVIQLTYTHPKSVHSFVKSDNKLCRQDLDACNSRDSGCVSVRISSENTRYDYACAMALRNHLMSQGVSASLPNPGYSSGTDACVGIREDLGGTQLGAECIVNILGPPYHIGPCNRDGWAYSVIVE